VATPWAEMAPRNTAPAPSGPPWALRAAAEMQERAPMSAAKPRRKAWWMGDIGKILESAPWMFWFWHQKHRSLIFGPAIHHMINTAYIGLLEVQKPHAVDFRFLCSFPSQFQCVLRKSRFRLSAILILPDKSLCHGASNLNVFPFRCSEVHMFIFFLHFV
jgi:hypothetical protein